MEFFTHSSEYSSFYIVDSKWQEIPVSWFISDCNKLPRASQVYGASLASSVNIITSEIRAV